MNADQPCPRPVMRYYGGKFRVASEIVALMPEHEVYVEPFGGAASVMLCKPPCPCEVYNDLYGDVVNVFRQMRDSGDALLRGLFLTPFSREEYQGAYEATTDAVEAARRFIFRSFAGVGSDSARRRCGFRIAMDEGKYAWAASWATLPESLRLVCERLRGVIIEHGEAGKVMAQFDGVKTLHYVDPPYLATTRKRQSRAYEHEMLGEKEHEALLAQVVALKGKVIVSGYDHKIYHRRLKGWAVREFKARDQRNGQRTEVVWMNYEPPCEQPELFAEVNDE
ncbi:MAG: DNA adenine methylase [Desulfurellales bacterium]|nr:MAG: DNA adenine methylase [Desulfurellales bacterium]